ncbi:MAG TPA: DUF2314 domain-containing protein [Pyrinomonadaceae bacterium]|nr:DUF2314 domain-containing protein [Pyrinomonadaceae bacterium]
MSLMRAFVVVLLLLTLGCGAPPAGEREVVRREGEADVYLVRETDEEMNRAIEEARRTLTLFLAALQSPKPGRSGFSVKHPFRQGEQVEHMWVGDVSFDGSVFRGTLDNAPRNLTNVEAGQEVEVPASQVSDWMYVEDGRLVGGYTLRVLHKQFTEEEKRAAEEAYGFKIE